MKYKVAQTGYMPSHNSSPVQRFEQYMELVCLAGLGNRVDAKFEEVVSCAKLISRLSREGSRKLTNNLLRFLQNTRLGNDDHCQHPSSLRLYKEFVDQAMKEQLTESNMIHVSICSSAMFSQQENHSMCIKRAIDLFCNQIKLAKLYQNSFRQSPLECQILEGGMDNQHACPNSHDFYPKSLRTREVVRLYKNR